MFIVKDSGNRSQILTEAEELKPSCEVYGGNLFVQLHFKAVKAVPDSVELINTAVTSRDESSAQFSGCGKHLVVVSSTDEETPLMRNNAVGYIKAYLGTMFGQDVGNSLKDEDVHTIDEKGQEMNAEALKKWEEQQKEKGGEDKESVDESIPSFGRFILSESDDDIEAENALDGEEDDGGGGDDDEDEEAGDGKEAEEAGDGEEAEEAGDGEEAEEAGDELPPPATYLIAYTIKADGQPETDHTDPKEVEKLSPKGSGLKLPDDNKYGIKFGSTLGGGSSDEIKFDKLGKDLAGKVDSDEIEKQIRTIMRNNFPDINQPSIEVRDQRTIDIELKRRISENEISRDEYNGKVQALIANADYSLWIEVKDYREKPFIGKKDIADVINAAVKEVGGRWAKLLSGVKEDGVIMLHGLSSMSTQVKGKDEVRRLIPTPSEIQAFIKKNKSTPANIWAEIDKKFKACEKKNADFGEAVAMEAIGKWKAFKKNRDSNSVTVKDYESFYSEYKEFYKNKVEQLLSEEFISERELMQEIFGILYEDDGGEKPGAGSESSGGDDEEFEEDDSDKSSGGGSDGGEGDVFGGADKKEDQITNIFIVPMKGLDVDMDKSRF